MNSDSENLSSFLDNADKSQRNIRLLVAYDGTGFSGWQRQNNGRSIQGDIETALKKIHKHPVVLTGSGRTDAGVHAAGQVANFYTSIKNMDASRFVPALNSLLQRDIRILEAREASSSFHARFDAKMRSYRYHLVCGRPAFPHELRYALQLWRCPDLGRLNDFARLLLGEFDCTFFASSRDESVTRFRYIQNAHFFIQGGQLIFEISANAFLWKMVRSIVGTLLFYEEEGITAARFADILSSGDHNLAGPTVPPNGLFLWNIDYYRD